MARRATKMVQIRKGDTSTRTIFIAGPYELAKPGQTRSDQVKLASFVQALQALDYDLVVLAPEEARLLKEQGIAIPESWEVLQPQPKLIRLEAGDMTVGVVLLAAGENALNTSVRFLENELAAGNRQPDVDLLLAVSSWGWHREKQFLQRSPKAVDVLLGSNRGPYENGRYYGPERVLWIRPYTRGKAINRVTVTNWPDRRSTASAAQAAGRLRADLVVIKSSLPKHPRIDSLFDQASKR